MPNDAIIKAVDDLIAKGRVSADLRNEYIQHFENNLQHDLLRGADYTNKTKALADERRKAEETLKAEYQKLQQERQKLEQWQGQVQGELKKLDALPEMTAKIAAYEQALRDYQIYDQVQVPTVPTNPQQHQQRFQQTPVERMRADENSPYMTMQTAGAALRDFALLQGKVAKIHAQHLKLFGEPLEDDLMSHYLDTGEDPEQHWKVKYAVDAKRNESFQAEQAARDAKIRQEAKEELMRELALDPTRVTGSPNPGRPMGGLTPLMDQYAHSRALANNPVAGQTGQQQQQQQGDFVPPEKKPDIMASRERVAAASRMFMEHFDVNGNPTSDKGRQLSRLYSD